MNAETLVLLVVVGARFVVPLFILDDRFRPVATYRDTALPVPVGSPVLQPGSAHVR